MSAANPVWGVDGRAHVGAEPGVNGDPDLLETHERAPADAVDDDSIDILLSQDEHRRHAAAFGVRGVGEDGDLGDLPVDDVDDGEAVAASEVPGALRFKTAGGLGRDGDPQSGSIRVCHVVRLRSWLLDRCEPVGPP